MMTIHPSYIFFFLRFIRFPIVTERAIRIRGEPDRGRRGAGDDQSESSIQALGQSGDRERRQVEFEPYVPFKKRMKSTTTTEPPTTTTPAPYNVL